MPFYRLHWLEDIDDLLAQDVSRASQRMRREPGKKLGTWSLAPGEYTSDLCCRARSRLQNQSAQTVWIACQFIAHAERLCCGTKPLLPIVPRCQSLPNVPRALFALAVSTCALIIRAPQGDPWTCHIIVQEVPSLFSLFGAWMISSSDGIRHQNATESVFLRAW